jgi:predicted dehydrogenase
VQICGTRGRIELHVPFNPPQGVATRISIDNGSPFDGKSADTETLSPCDQFTLESEAFSRAVRGEIPLPYGVEDALMNMRIIDALFRSEKSGRFEEV